MVMVAQLPQKKFYHSIWYEDPSTIFLKKQQDDTLIRVKSGGKFAKNADDWLIWHDKVVPTIKDYHSKGYKIVIMTNQGGIEKGHTKESDIKKKIQNLTEHVSVQLTEKWTQIHQIGVPIQALISPFKNYYRKPSPGLT